MAKFRENIEHPLQFQYEIMQRFMSEKDLKTFVDDYRNARKTKHTMSAPSPHQIRMASLVKEFGYVEAAKKIGVPVYQVRNVVRRVSTYNYLNS